jgi:hypothetical protein
MLLRTNTNEYKRNMEAYIFDCINNEDEELLSIQSKLEYVISEFKRVANYPSNIHNIPNNINRMADYLQGLPFDFAFDYVDILKHSALLHNLGSIPKNKEDTIIKGWFNHIASNIFKLCDKYNIQY